MVSVQDIKSNLTTLLDRIYAKAVHSHGDIDNNGAIGSSSNKIITTGTNGKLRASDAISKSQISDFPTSMTPTTHTHTTSEITNFPTIGTGLSTNDFSDAYKNKLNALSTYQIRLTDTKTWNLNTAMQNNPQLYPNYPHVLYVEKQRPTSGDDNRPVGQIYCLVTTNKTQLVTSGQIIFIVNGKTYISKIKEDGFATLSIRLSTFEYDTDAYINSGGQTATTKDAIYTVIAVYRPDGEWTEAIDIKQMLVSGPDA